jgi:hypothetical protein
MISGSERIKRERSAQQEIDPHKGSTMEGMEKPTTK